MKWLIYLKKKKRCKEISTYRFFTMYSEKPAFLVYVFHTNLLVVSE